MNQLVHVKNGGVSEQAEKAGACGGFLLGALAGASVSSKFWWLGPVAPVAIAGSILLGGAVGALGGGSLGKVVASQLDS